MPLCALESTQAALVARWCHAPWADLGTIGPIRPCLLHKLGRETISAQWPDFELKSFSISICISDSIQALDFHINSNIAPKFMKPTLLHF
jgi:hypothetical protein